FRRARRRAPALARRRRRRPAGAVAGEFADHRPRHVGRRAVESNRRPHRPTRGCSMALAYSGVRQTGPALDPIAVIDFETTGLSPAQGDRATEIAIVLLEGTQVVGRFQSLMNAGVRVSPFIEAYTGISNQMIRAAPPAAEV